MTVSDVFHNTDWKLLSKQKLHLISACNRFEELEGLLNWIDSIQEAAEDAGFPVVWLTTGEDK
jgi:hypothetical protein